MTIKGKISEIRLCSADGKKASATADVFIDGEAAGSIYFDVDPQMARVGTEFTLCDELPFHVQRLQATAAACPVGSGS